ncbi:T9SS type A sorting domain-containing protein [Crocinitomix catalasitica]|nr:T9SS type A sorting domain-containing protein [Crocinitomix catalasitica]
MIINDGDSLFVGGGWQTSSGTYVDTLLTAEGCDSIVTTNLTVAVGLEDLMSANFKLYPNPTSGEIFLDIGIEEEINLIELRSASGQLIDMSYEFTDEGIKLNISAVSNGIYFLYIRIGNFLIFKTIEKM